MLRSPWTKVLLFILCLGPVGWLGWRFQHDDLTANPVEYITHLTGDWTLRFLLFSLAITPLRRVFQSPDLIRFRRMLGLFAFFYGSLHFLTWFGLDKDFSTKEILQDVIKRPFITAGFLGLVLMAPLALTSTKGWVRRLGAKRWQQLHRLVYVSVIAGVVHYYWLVKSDIREPALYGAIAAVLLGARLFKRGTSVPASGSRSLQLAAIKPETKDSMTLRFPLSPGIPLGAKAGQFLTFEFVIDGRKMPRSYSISSSPRESNYVEVTVKEQGVVSKYLTRDAKVGLQVEAHGPFGQFYFDEGKHRDIVLFAAGSGITPIMSMLRYIEHVAPDTNVMLFYAVRTEHDVIFEKDIEQLRKRLPNLRTLVVPTRPSPAWGSRGPSGRLNRHLIEVNLSSGSIAKQSFFLCGPAGFMQDIEEVLYSLGANPAQVNKERFTVGTPSPEAVKSAPPCSIEFAKSGRTVDCSAAQSILSVAEDHGIELPFDCRVGQCGTCATKVLEGEVEMEVEDGLDPAMKASGYRLMCVGHAKGRVKLEA